MPVARVVPGGIVWHSSCFAGFVFFAWKNGHLGYFVGSDRCPFVAGFDGVERVGFVVFRSVWVRWCGTKYVPGLVGRVPDELCFFVTRFRVLA